MEFFFLIKSIHPYIQSIRYPSIHILISSIRYVAIFISIIHSSIRFIPPFSSSHLLCVYLIYTYYASAQKKRKDHNRVGKWSSFWLLPPPPRRKIFKYRFVIFFCVRSTFLFFIFSYMNIYF
ncbi:hypothetical protein BDC45DRAFT_202989 [Circinella umbellata]|nr:hypothetical protein BDC45DRAFT_202989 [Circinella umbellata]